MSLQCPNDWNVPTPILIENIPSEGNEDRAIILQLRGNSPAMQKVRTESYNETANRTPYQLKQIVAEAQTTLKPEVGVLRWCPSTPLHAGDSEPEIV